MKRNNHFNIGMYITIAILLSLIIILLCSPLRSFVMESMTCIEMIILLVALISLFPLYCCLSNAIYSMRIIKKIQYLPVTIEELKSLNINSYEELESYILNVFLKDLRGHVRVNLYSTYITLEKYIRKTLLVYVKYYIDSSTDDEIILFIQQVANDTVDDRDFKEFIRLRAGALVAKFLDYEEVPYWDNNISTDLDESIFRFVNQL